MKTIDKNSLLEFYFGSLEEGQRLSIEKEMLTDPEVLLDYLDLKREIEGSQTVPQQASPFLWNRLRQSIPKKKVWYFSLAALGAATAAALICFYFLSHTQVESQRPAVTENGILFDSGSEHSFASGVM